jgi:hypothetical protein
VLSRTFVENQVIVHCRIANKYLGKLKGSLKEQNVKIRPYGESQAWAPPFTEELKVTEELKDIPKDIPAEDDVS